MLEIRDLSVSYGNKTILQSFSLRAKAGERIRLSGESGSGKTTLLAVIAGLKPPDGGTVRVNGTIAYLFQEPRLLPWQTARENVELVLPRGADKSLAARYLTEAELGGDMDRYPSELSGGMCRRVALARALAYADAANAGILLFDEPFTGLDAERKERLYPKLLRAAEGKLLILATHDDAEAAALCEKTVRLP